jgi:hypothetical protein
MCAPSSSLTLLIWGTCSNPLRVWLRTPDQQGHCGVAARCPRLIYIYRAHGLVAKPALELLISNPLDSRVSVVPTLAKRGLEPPDHMRTLRGSVFSSLRLGPFEGLAYVIRSQAVLMPPVATTVMRHGRAFSGGAAARIAGDVGVDMTGRRGPSVVAP